MGAAHRISASPVACSRAKSHRTFALVLRLTTRQQMREGGAPIPALAWAESTTSTTTTICWLTRTRACRTASPPIRRRGTQPYCGRSSLLLYVACAGIRGGRHLRAGLLMMGHVIPAMVHRVMGWGVRHPRRSSGRSSWLAHRAVACHRRGRRRGGSGRCGGVSRISRQGKQDGDGGQRNGEAHEMSPYSIPTAYQKNTGFATYWRYN